MVGPLGPRQIRAVTQVFISLGHDVEFRRRLSAWGHPNAPQSGGRRSDDDGAAIQIAGQDGVVPQDQPRRQRLQIAHRDKVQPDGTVCIGQQRGVGKIHGQQPPTLCRLCDVVVGTRRRAHQFEGKVGIVLAVTGHQ